MEYQKKYQVKEFMLQGKIWIHLWDSYMGQPAFHCIVDRASLIQTHDSHKRRTRWTSARETIRYRALKTPPLSEPQQKPNKQAITRRKDIALRNIVNLSNKDNSKALCKIKAMIFKTIHEFQSLLNLCNCHKIV